MCSARWKQVHHHRLYDHDGIDICWKAGDRLATGIDEVRGGCEHLLLNAKRYCESSTRV